MRRREMAAAAKLPGADLFHGNVGDGELADIPDQRKKLIEIYRRFKPTLILAHCPDDYHADHRATSALAEAATPGSTAPVATAPAPLDSRRRRRCGG